MCRDPLACAIERAAGMTEPDFITLLALVVLGLGFAAFLGLQVLEAPYGRYNQDAKKTSALFGFPMDGRVAWFLQEIPCVAWVAYGIHTADPIAF